MSANDKHAAAYHPHDGPTKGVTGMTAIWHKAYCRWYDNDRSGNRRRAAMWGWIADRIARWA